MKHWLTILTVAMSLCLNIAIVVRDAFSQDEKLPVIVPPNEQNDLANPATVHQKGIDDYIKRVAGLSTVELEDSLADYEESTQATRRNSDAFASDNPFAEVLANRRLAKLYVEYRSGTDEDSCVRAKRLAHKWLTEHKARVVQLNKSLLAGGGTNGEPSRSKYACASCAFLVMCLCPPQDAIDYLNEWEKSIRTIFEGIEIQERGKESLSRMTMPGDVFVVNMCIVGLGRKMSPIDLQDELANKIRVDRLSNGVFCAWDADMTRFDFTRINKGLPIDEKKVLAQFQYLWSFWAVGAMSDAAQKGLRKRAVESLLGE